MFPKYLIILITRQMSCTGLIIVARDSSVDIAARYGADGPGNEYRAGGGEDFPHHSRPALGPTQPPVQWKSVPFSGVKSGRGVSLIIYHI